MAEINGLSAKQWWENLLHEMVMGLTGLSTADALDKYLTPDFWRQDGPRVITRDMLGHHCDWVRNLPDLDQIEVIVRHASFDGEYFAADHVVKGPNGDKGDYELEVLTFAKMEDGRVAWLKELYWLVKGEGTSWDQEFDTYRSETAD
ncbi:hypothetical protein [Nonomuraea lactucae]|uniref:hypothetical protein n=1 Tax=Nonomuraea lactucae TaxID=2249762 RepID=UPI000DE5552E|nr:hypothetical protein [Nonomuraea lactucae]